MHEVESSPVSVGVTCNKMQQATLLLSNKQKYLQNHLCCLIFCDSDFYAIRFCPETKPFSFGFNNPSLLGGIVED